MKGLSPEEENQFLSQSQLQPETRIEMNIYAENKETLDEFVYKQADFDLNSYLYLKKQVEKGKYSIALTQEGLVLDLKVFDPFVLRRIEKDSSEMLKDYYREVFRVNADLKKQTCLFNYFFLHVWSEKRREGLGLVLGPNMHRDVIASLESLYHVFRVWGNVDMANPTERNLVSTMDWAGYVGEDFAEALLWQNGMPIIDERNNVTDKSEEASGRVVKVSRQWSYELEGQGKFQNETWFVYSI